MEGGFAKYNPENFVFARRKFIYEGQESLPEYWRPYFSMSIEGNEYEILELTEGEFGAGATLVMSDTEYEVETNKPFFEALESGMDILSLGYGIGLIVPIVVGKGCNLTVVEKYQQVMDLEENLDPNVEIIIGDANDVLCEEEFLKRKFDIIYSDLTETFLQRENLSKLLKEDGQAIFWDHLK